MQSLGNISWSKYSWWDIWQIIKAYSAIIPDDSNPEPFNSNILHIAAKSCDLELMKKVLNTEENIDINEKDANGWTALHIVSYFGKLDMIKFLVAEKSADYKITTEYGESPLFLCVWRLNFETTKYYLELGEEIPLSACNRVGDSTHKFLQKLTKYFQLKLTQEADGVKYQGILSQIQQKQEENTQYTSNNSDEPAANTPVVDKQNNIMDLIGEENV